MSAPTFTPEDQAFVHVFGRQPPRETAWLRAPDDAGDGIPVVYRGLTGVRQKQLNKDLVTRYPSDIEQAGGWVWETLVQGLESVDGNALPDDDDRRRAIILEWQQGAVERLAEGYAAFQAGIRASWELVMASPKSPGANAGPSSAPEAAGATASSA